VTRAEGPFRAVVFDMDGVLADTEPLHFEAAREVLAAEGRDYTWEMNRRFFGRTSRYVFETLAAEMALPRAVAEYLAVYDATVTRRLRAPLRPSEGLAELLDALAARGVPAALASSSQLGWIEETLASLGLTGRFAPVVAGDMVREGKPSPEIYLLAAERLGLPAAACVAIEDSPAGLTAARAAGMHAVGLATPYFERGQLAAAHDVIETLRAFPLALVG
jgi:HAD superfamily hydrolase (TIGR01509 family)